jgi:PAS domain-containing protein
METKKVEGSIKTDENFPESTTGVMDCSNNKENIQSGEEKNDEVISLLNSTLNSIKEGILVVNLTGKIVFYNKKFLEIWNIPEDIISKKDDEITIKFVLSQLKNPDEFVQKVNNLYSNPSDEGHDLLKFKDGRIIERFSLPQVFNNKITGRVWSFFDLTDQVISKESLIKEKGSLQVLLDNVPDTIYFKDIESKFTLINKAQARVLGISDPKEAEGKSDFDFFELEHAAAAFEDEQNIM